MSGVRAAHLPAAPAPATPAISANPAADSGAVANGRGSLSFVDILSGQMDLADLLGKVLDPKQAEAAESTAPESLDSALLESLGLVEVPALPPASIPALTNAAEPSAIRRDDLLPGQGPTDGLAKATLALAQGQGRQERGAAQLVGEAVLPGNSSGSDSASTAIPTAIVAADVGADSAKTASTVVAAKSAVATRPLESLATAAHDPNSAATAALQASAAAIAPAHAAIGQTGAAAEFRIVTPLGGDRWQDAIGDSLVIMAGQQQNRAELVLTPPQLGRVEVSLTMTGDQANALFVSANPAVREALESALPRLRELLADAGIVLNSQVGSELPRNAADSDARGGLAGRPAHGDEAPGRALGLAIAAGAAGARIAMGNGRGLVDVFA